MMESSADFVDLGNRPLPGRILTFPIDMHPNPDGHRYVAQEIFSWIDREMPELPSGSDS